MLSNKEVNVDRTLLHFPLKIL